VRAIGGRKPYGGVEFRGGLAIGSGVHLPILAA